MNIDYLMKIEKSSCMRLLTVVLLVIVLGSSSALAEILDPRFLKATPSDKWFSLNTPNFDIHFRADNRDYAYRLARIAERQHAVLSDAMQWSPANRTQIVVNDQVDFSNGASTIYPYNQFFVYLDEPVSGPLKDNADFAELLFTHEYTHILNMDQVSGLPSVLRSLFGKSPNPLLLGITIPNALTPHWVTEGIAIYNESLGGAGRNNNSIYEAMMREEVRTGLASFSEESYEGYYSPRWPFGQVYLYGAYFFQFLAERYGEGAITEYFDTYSDNLIPWQMHTRSSATTGKNATALWNEFHHYLQTRFAGQLAKRAEASPRRGEILFAKTWENRLLTAGPDGSVFFYHKDEMSSPVVMQLFADGSSREVLRDKSISAIAYHPDAGLLLSRFGVCENSALYTDLYRYDLDTKSLERLTHCARLPRAAWSHDGDAIFAVQTDSGLNRLVRVSLDGDIETLHELSAGESIGHPFAAADGRRLIVDVKRQYGKEYRWGVEIFYFESASWERISKDTHLYSRPFFDQAGDACFVSDQSANPELQCMDLLSGARRELSDSLGFVHAGVESADGSYWVSEYTGDGDVIRLLSGESRDVNDSAIDTVNIDTKPRLVESLEVPSALVFSETRYAPLKTLRPRGWAPLALFSEDFSLYGIAVTGSDVLGFHSWALSPIVYEIEDSFNAGGIINYSLYERLFFSLSRSWVADYDDDGDVLLSTERTDNAQLLATFPLNHVDWGFSWFIGAAAEQVEDEYTNNLTVELANDRVAGLGFTFNNLTQYKQAISPSRGVHLSAQIESFDLLGGSTTHIGYAGLWQSFFNYPLAGNRALSLAIDAGLSEEGGKPFRLGDSQYELDTLGGSTRLGQRKFPFRGYSRSAELTGRYFARSTLAWHNPLATIYDGLSVPPVGLGRINSTVFAEFGDAWFARSDRELYASIGVEVDAELLVGYDSVRLPLALGYARGLEDDLGEDMFYLRLDLAY